MKKLGNRIDSVQNRMYDRENIGNDFLNKDFIFIPPLFIPMVDHQHLDGYHQGFVLDYCFHCYFLLDLVLHLHM